MGKSMSYLKAPVRPQGESMRLGTRRGMGGEVQAEEVAGVRPQDIAPGLPAEEGEVIDLEIDH